MPWLIRKREDEWCVYKEVDGSPSGDALGCHPSEAAAKRQLAALYANEPEARRSLLAEGDALVAFGSAVKALGDGRVGGHLVRFTSADEPDLEGEYFTRETDYGPHKTSLVYYQHGKDAKLQRRALDEDAELGIDDIGVWIEAQLDMRDQYERWIYEQAQKGRMGWSSGTAPHLTEREQTGRATRITKWPLGLDASLTPTPVDPGNRVIALKSWEPAQLDIDAEELPEDGGEPSAVKATEPGAPEPIVVNDRTEEPNEMAEEQKTAEVTQAPTVDMDAMIKAAVQDAVGKTIEAMKEVPAVERQFATQPEGTDRPETKSFGDFCIAVQRGDVKRLKSVYGASKAELAETSGSVGGYLVPPEFSEQILRVATEGAVVRPRATIIPMRAREWNVPALSYSGTTAGEPHSLGGVVATWTEEGGAKTETEPTFDTIKLVYHELSGYTVADNMLRLDAGETLTSMLTNLFGQAIAWYEDYAFLRGTGGGMPLGIFESDCLVCEVAASSTFVLDDAAAMLEMFMSRDANGGVWVMHPKVLSKLITMTDGTASGVLWIPNAREREPASLFGRPIIFSEKMPVLPPGSSATTKGGVLLADFSYYLIGSRQQIQIDFSEHFKFTENKGTWRFVELVDGQPWMKTYRTLADGTNTVSPFVSLSGA